MDEMTKLILGVAAALIAVIWAMLRQESKKTEDALEKKASSVALEEAKNNHKSEMRELRDHFQERIRELNQRQDREIDWLKQETSEIKSSISEMRQEQTAANNALIQNLQQLTITVQRGRRHEPN